MRSPAAANPAITPAEIVAECTRAGALIGDGMVETSVEVWDWGMMPVGGGERTAASVEMSATLFVLGSDLVVCIWEEGMEVVSGWPEEVELGELCVVLEVVVCASWEVVVLLVDVAAVVVV